MPTKTPTEQTIINQIRRQAATAKSRTVSLGIGDDCAILTPPPGHEIVVTTDFCLENRHFRRDWHTPESAGHRTLARGLSDLAAMGATPLAAFLSIALPADFDPKWLTRYLKGLLDLAKTHKVPLAGGDTAQAPGAEILADIVLLGHAPRGQSLRRSTARPGDKIYVTGPLGGSAAQLANLDFSVGPQTHPQPRLKIGQTLLRRKLATACIDISDGLSTDLTHFCQASGVGATIHSDLIPIHSTSTLAQALHGGEDYELLFTSNKKIPKTIATQIGQITERKILLDTKPLKPQGWQHFKTGNKKLAAHS